MRALGWAALAAVVAVTGCSAGASSGAGSDAIRPGAAQPRAAAPSSLPNWPTYHGNNRRTGGSGSPPLQAPLRRAWTARLDGAVYAQPLVVHGLVIAATENDTVYALHPEDGRVAWRHHLGTPAQPGSLPCPGNIDPLGITGAPAYDARTGSVFVVTERTGGRHTLRALNPKNGHQRWRRSLDVLAGRDRSAEQQRAAILVAHGRVYAAFGGLYGDCGNYGGYVVSAPTDGTGHLHHYAVPTAREAGIWAPPGPVQHRRDGNLYVSSGNGAATSGHYDGSDSVIELSPTLKKVAMFAPSTWGQDNAQDLDLGSSAPVVLSSGQIVAAGKRGTVYLVNSLRGVGSQRAPLGGCAAYGGAAVHRRTVYLPCSGGVRRLHVGTDSLHWQWQAGVTGSPVLARGAVYVLDQDSGALVELSAKTGRQRTRLAVGPMSRFATPVPVGTRVYVGTMSGVVAVRGS